VHLTLANISVGAKHDRIQHGIITNNLYTVMLRPLQKPDAPGTAQTSPQTTNTNLASLWYVSDEGMLALISEFYHQLKIAPIKAEAL
jgi:hypothetical protein